MIEKTWILEYIGGCKGDLLTRCLNNLDVPMNKFLKTAKLEVNLKKYNGYYEQPSIYEFCKILEESKKFKFINAHESPYFDKKEYSNKLKEKNIGIKKILFSEKYYKTIYIEGVFKNTGYFLSLVDNSLNKQGLEINEKNRIHELYNFINKTHYNRFIVFNKIKKLCLNKDLLNYEDLFINFKCDDKDINDNINWETLKIKVEKSWLPEKFKFLNHTWNLKELGYRNF